MSDFLGGQNQQLINVLSMAISKSFLGFMRAIRAQ